MEPEGGASLHRARDGCAPAAPQTFSNDYFKRLLEDKWEERKWKGPRQFENSKSGRDLMMLPADLALTADPEFRCVWP